MAEDISVILSKKCVFKDPSHYIEVFCDHKDSKHTPHYINYKEEMEYVHKPLQLPDGKYNTTKSPCLAVYVVEGISRDRKYLVGTTDRCRKTVVWNLESGLIQWSIQHLPAYYYLHVCNNSKYVVLHMAPHAYASSDFYVYNIDNGEPVSVVPARGRSIIGIHDTSIVTRHGYSGDIEIYNLHTGAIEKKVVIASSSIIWYKLTPDGTCIVYMPDPFTLSVYNIESESVIFSVGNAHTRIQSYNISPDSRHIIVCGDERNDPVIIYNIETQGVVKTIENDDFICEVGFTSNTTFYQKYLYFKKTCYGPI